MNRDWAMCVRREYIAGSPRYDFPVRPLGWARLIGVFLVGFGVWFAWGPGHTAWGFIHKLLNGDQRIGNVIFGVFPLLFVAAAGVPFGVGLLILFGRSRVEWRNGQLWSAEILGPLRWTRRLTRKPLRKLEVSTATSMNAGSPPRQIENFAGLNAVFADGSKSMVVFGYPRTWLLEMAEELKGCIGGGAAVSSPVEIVEASPLNENDADVAQQPAGSRVEFEDRVGGGVRLVVPPAGLWRGSKGLFFFAMMWCGFMAVFTILMIASGLKTESGGKAGGLLPILFVMVFWVIGLGLLAAAINLARRTATFEVGGGLLRIETQSLFGNKQWEWKREVLAAVRADASGMEVNNRPVLQLQIHPHGAKKVGLLSGREEAELRWLATRLRQALNVPAR